MQITSSSSSKEIAPMALAIHQLVNKLPITMRCKNSNGVRIEEDKIIDYDYTGPVLEKVLEKGKFIHETPETGTYEGIPVLVVPIIEGEEVIGAIGIVDITRGVFSDLMQIARRPDLIKSETPKGEFY
ncbi:DUF2111 domain-containing protein [Methanobacterium sp.]|uniref:DUF2111 domain-containing protein n=1 Tax=Methanobacterium sp. TaxID=2164 RepID=UPI003C74893B